MKISEIFNLHKTQHELDFVDIDPARDKPVFIDPFFVSTRKHAWCSEASRTTRDFFQCIIDLIRKDELERAQGIFVHLNEPNETCLGLSKGTPQGRGVAEGDSKRIFESILESKAVVTGLVDDLEDTAIFIDGVSKDKVSDMTTNIIRMHLLKYTEGQCRLWGIPLEPDVPSGFFWDTSQKTWDNVLLDRLVVDDRPLLLVPKIAVSFHREYIDQKYYQHFVLNYLQGEHLDRNSSLVRERTLKDGSKLRYVTKEDIKKEDAPFSKEFLRDFTQKHPDVFKKFKDAKSRSVSPIRNEELEEIDIVELIDYLVTSLQSIAPGGQEAYNYHKLILGVLELIFYPNLTNPTKEKEINQGRKRIDIVFDNSATDGFFYNLHDIHKITSRYIYAECKNYSEDPKNPEIDQLSGRFSVNSTMVGILVCRTIGNKNLFLQRCIDLWKQKSEMIIPLADQDIILILNALKNGKVRLEENLLKETQKNIIVS